MEKVMEEQTKGNVVIKYFNHKATIVQTSLIHMSAVRSGWVTTPPPISVFEKPAGYHARNHANTRMGNDGTFTYSSMRSESNSRSAFLFFFYLSILDVVHEFQSKVCKEESKKSQWSYIIFFQIFHTQRDEPITFL